MSRDETVVGNSEVRHLKRQVQELRIFDAPVLKTLSEIRLILEQALPRQLFPTAIVSHTAIAKRAAVLGKSGDANNSTIVTLNILSYCHTIY